MKDTKERILQTSLCLFAANGYDAVSVSTIASELGITKGALYKHYENKRDIFEHILLRMQQQDAERAGEFDLPEQTFEENRESYFRVSLERLLAFSKAQFIYWTEDPFASLFRRMLTLEQYRSIEMTNLYMQYLSAGPLKYVEDILRALDIKEPRKKAVELYSPMFLMYSVYDGADDKENVLSVLDSVLDDAYRRLMKEGESCS